MLPTLLLRPLAPILPANDLKSTNWHGRAHSSASQTSIGKSGMLTIGGRSVLRKGRNILATCLVTPGAASSVSEGVIGAKKFASGSSDSPPIRCLRTSQ